MVRRFRPANAYTSSLSGAIGSGDTSISVVSATGLPSEGDFFITIGTEILLVTHVSGTTLTVIRGQAGTSASAWGSGKGVSTINTKQLYYEMRRERMQEKALPYGRITASDGTVLTAADWTLVNTATGSGVDDGADGIISFRSRDHSGDNVSGAIRNFPSGTDMRFIMHFACPGLEDNTSDYMAHYVRMQTGGQMYGVAFYPDLKVELHERVSYLGSPTGVVASHGAYGRTDCWFMTTLEWNWSGSSDRYTWYYSWDGVHWWQLGSHSFASSTASMGIWARASTGSQANHRFDILSWHEEPL